MKSFHSFRYARSYLDWLNFIVFYFTLRRIQHNANSFFILIKRRDFFTTNLNHCYEKIYNMCSNTSAFTFM